MTRHRHCDLQGLLSRRLGSQGPLTEDSIPHSNPHKPPGNGDLGLGLRVIRPGLPIESVGDLVCRGSAVWPQEGLFCRIPRKQAVSGLLGMCHMGAKSSRSVIEPSFLGAL